MGHNGLSIWDAQFTDNLIKECNVDSAGRCCTQDETDMFIRLTYPSVGLQTKPRGLTANPG